MSAMSQVILALISGLVGAVVGGAMTVWGSMKALNTNPFGVVSETRLAVGNVCRKPVGAL
jgi:hypothetical protein